MKFCERGDCLAMVNKWRDVRVSKNMKKVHEVAMYSAVRIPFSAVCKNDKLNVSLYNDLRDSISIFFYIPISFKMFFSCYTGRYFYLNLLLLIFNFFLR